MKKRLENHIHHREVIKEILNAETVKQIFTDTLAENNKVCEEEAQEVEGVQLHVFFCRQKLKHYADQIKTMLKQMNHKYKEGWTFLNFVENGLEFQWTSLHLDADMLLCLGLAHNYIEYCAPRELWSHLPGGVPYIRIINID